MQVLASPPESRLQQQDKKRAPSSLYNKQVSRSIQTAPRQGRCLFYGSGEQRPPQFLRPEHRHASLEVPGLGCDCNFRCRPGQSAHQQPRMAKDPVLQASKRLLHRTAAPAHCICRCALVHPLQHFLMQLTPDQPPLLRRTAGFEWSVLAVLFTRLIGDGAVLAH